MHPVCCFECSYYLRPFMLNPLVLFAQVPFAQVSEVPAATPTAVDSNLWVLVMIPAFLILMWFLMVSPQKKQEKRLQNMLDSLEKNDKVMTVGGLIGIVHAVDREQNEIILKVDDGNNTKIHFHLTAVSHVFPKGE